MPFQHLPRPSFILASVLAVAGIVLAVAGCGHITPLGPGPTPVAMPPARHLGSPIILQVMRSRPDAASGKCPVGYVALSAPGYAGTCYSPVGTPVTITSAAVSSVSTYPPPPGQSKVPASYGFTIGVPAADVAEVTAVIKQAYDVRGALAVIVAGKTWEAPQVIQPFPGQQFQTALPGRSQALDLYRLLVPSG